MYKKIGLTCIGWVIFYICMSMWWNINTTYQESARLMVDTNLALRSSLYQTQVADDYFTQSGTGTAGTYYGGDFTGTSTVGPLTAGTEPYVYEWDYGAKEFYKKSLLRTALGDATASKDELLKLYVGPGSDYDKFVTDIKANTGGVFNVTYTDWMAGDTSATKFLLDSVGVPYTGYGGTYYYTPIALGVTYLQPQVLKTAFESNLQVLARSAFIAGTGTTQLTGSNSQLNNGTGLLNSGDYGRFAAVSGLNPTDPRWLNNGEYEIDLSSLHYTVKYYMDDMSGGATPTLDNMTKYLFGKTSSQLSGQDTGGSLYGSTTDVHTTPGFLVAEVTVTMDAYIPYTNPFLRWLADESGNLFTGANGNLTGSSTSTKAHMTGDANNEIQADTVVNNTDKSVERHGGIHLTNYTVRALFSVTR